MNGLIGGRLNGCWRMGVRKLTISIAIHHNFGYCLLLTGGEQGLVSFLPVLLKCVLHFSKVFEGYFKTF